VLRIFRKAAVAALMATAIGGATAGVANAQTTVDWNSFPELGPDRIVVTEPVAGGVPEGHVRLQLQTPAYISWWKALDAKGWNGWNYGWVETKDANHGPNSMLLDVANTKEVILAKGGFLGTYKAMYRIDHDTLLQKLGKTIRFNWQRD
jgi:hypothetical protein